MNKNEVIGFKIAEYLMAKGFVPAIETKYNAKGMLLVNKEGSPYGAVFISMEDQKPEYYHNLITSIHNGIQKKVVVLSFEEISLKFEYEGGELYACGKSLHNDLEQAYPGLNDIYISKGAVSNEVNNVLVKDLQNKVIKDLLKETSRAATVVKSRSDFSMWFLAALFALAAVVPYLLVDFLLPEVWINVSETTRLILSGASYAALTFEDNQYWRLLTGFLVNDIIWIAIVLLSLRQVIPTVESLYGKARTILIFMITGVIITYAKTIIHAHELSYGAQEVIFCMLGMLLYYGYYDRLLWKMYLPRSIQAFVILGLISIIFNPTAILYIVLSIILGYLLSSILGFKNTERTKEMAFPIIALTSFIGLLVFLQSRLNWSYSNIDYAKSLLRQLWSKLT